MKPQKYELITNDVFAESFTEFKETAFYEKLEKKFKPKSYFQKFRVLYITTLLASYGFNIFSALTASTAVYFFVWSLTGNNIVSVLATLVFIALLEIFKRLSSSRFFQNIIQYQKFGIGLFSFIVGLTLVSVAFSYQGAKEAVLQFTSNPTLEKVDDLTSYHKNQMEALDLQINEARNTRWNGTTTSTSQRTIKDLTAQKKALQDQVLMIETETRKKNESTLKTHETATKLNASHFAAFTLLLEALFLLCAWYIEYYSFRSYAEFSTPVMVGKVQNTTIPIASTAAQKAIPITNGNHNIKPLENGTSLARASNHKPVAVHIPASQNNHLDKNVIDLAIKKVRNKITTAEYRLRNGIGKKETSEKNRAQAQQELNQLIQHFKSL